MFRFSLVAIAKRTSEKIWLTIFLLSCFTSLPWPLFKIVRSSVSGWKHGYHVPAGLKPLYHNLCSMSPIRSDACLSTNSILFLFYPISTMAQMAHFSFPYYFTIPNFEFRIPKVALRISDFGIVKYIPYTR